MQSFNWSRTSGREVEVLRSLCIGALRTDSSHSGTSGTYEIPCPRRTQCNLLSRRTYERKLLCNGLTNLQYRVGKTMLNAWQKVFFLKIPSKKCTLSYCTSIWDHYIFGKRDSFKVRFLLFPPFLLLQLLDPKKESDTKISLWYCFSVVY